MSDRTTAQRYSNYMLAMRRIMAVIAKIPCQHECFEGLRSNGFYETIWYCWDCRKVIEEWSC